MPTTIPKRQPQVGTPTAKGIRVGANNQASNAMKLLGNAVMRHTERIQAQHDVATAHTVFRGLRDEARLELDSHLVKEGAEAMNTLGSYSRWFDDKAGKVEFGLQNETQKQLFRTSADTIRGRDLDTLSNHQAKQHKLSLIRAVKTQSLSGDHEIVLSPLEQTISEELGKTKEILRALYPGETDEQLEERLDEDSKRYRTIALKQMLKDDPAEAIIHVELWKENLGDQYADKKKMVYQEGLFQAAVSKFPEDHEAQYDFVKNFEGVEESTKNAALGRINAYQNEIDSREKTLYTKAVGDAQDMVAGYILSGDTYKALKTVENAYDLKDTERLMLQRMVESSLTSDAKPFTVSDTEYVTEQLKLANEGKLDRRHVIPIDGRMSIPHTNAVIAAIDRYEKEASGEEKTHLIRARKATKSIIESFEYDEREEAMDIANKLNELDDYAKRHPDADLNKYVNEVLLAEEKSSWVVDMVSKMLTFGAPFLAPSTVYKEMFGSDNTEQYETEQQVTDDYEIGILSRREAEEILIDQFGAERD